MVHCKHCSTNNSLDSTFCKKCGTGLPEEDIAAAVAKLDVILAEGNSKLNEGKVSEAMAIAEAGVEINPSSVLALSLKANCHERQGEIAEALECAERIVELNPDSELDKIRRNQLRSALVLRAQPPSGADRRFALVASVAAVLLVISSGVIAVKLFNPTTKATSEGLVAQNDRPQTSTDRPFTSNPSTPTNGEATNSTPQTQPSPAPANPNPTTAEQAPKVPDLSAGRATETLPRPDSGESNTTEIRPFPPQVAKNGTSTNTSLPPANPVDNSATPQKNVDPDPVPVKDTNAGTVTPPAQKESGGEISINVHSTRPKLPGGSESVDAPPVSAGGAKAYSRVGNEQFMLGNYAAAASSLERALQNGADPLAVNQRLGQAYQRLGRKSDAAGAYQRAIQAADRAIQSGKGDKDRLISFKESCQAAIRVVGN